MFYEIAASALAPWRLPLPHMIRPSPFVCAAVFSAGLAAKAAAAPEGPLRELCADRPGKDTPACIVDKGHAIIETGALRYTRGPEGAEQFALGTLLARFGVTDRAELQFGFAPFKARREIDEQTGAQRTIRGTGDLTVAVRRNFLSPDGSGTAIAAQVFVTAPVGEAGIGAGDWQGGIIIPISYDLTQSLKLTVDPQVDVRANESRGGHHMAYVGVASVSSNLGGGISGTAEIWSAVDRDPDQPTTRASFDLMVAWVPVIKNDLQFDVEVDLGLTSTTPAVEVRAGVAVRF